MNTYSIAYVFNVCIFGLCKDRLLDVYFYCIVRYLVFECHLSGFRTIIMLILCVVQFSIFMYYSYCLQFNICGIKGQFNNPNHCCFKLTYNEFIFIISRIIFKNIPNRSWIFTVDSSLMIKINLQRTYFYPLKNIPNFSWTSLIKNGTVFNFSWRFNFYLLNLFDFC